MKCFFRLLFVVLMPAIGWTWYTTPNSGVRWTMDDLVANSAGKVTGSAPSYVLHDDVSIKENDTLIIQEGTTITRDDGGVWPHFLIEGKIVAQGTESNPIRITSGDLRGGDADYDRALEIASTVSGDSVIEWVVCEKADYGLYVKSDSHLTVKNCIFRDNNRGVYACGLIRFEGCVIENNGSEARPLGGAGIAVDDAGVSEASVVLTNCTIQRNHAFGGNSGGGVRLYEGDLLIADCEISENSATYGGGFFTSWMDVQSNVRILNSVIRDNAATTAGGGIYFSDDYAVDAVMLVSNCTIRANRECQGAGIFSYKASPEIYDCVIENNTTAINSNLGGGIGFKFVTNGIISGCTIRSNNAQYGGAVYLYSCENLLVQACAVDENGFVDSDADRNSEGFQIDQSSGIDVKNCQINDKVFYWKSSGTVVNNLLCYMGMTDSSPFIANNYFSTNSFAVYFYGDSSPVIQNNIFASGAFLDVVELESSPAVQYNVFMPASNANVVLFYRVTDKWLTVDAVNALERCGSNFLADPLFASETDFHLKSKGGRWDASQNQWVFDEVTSPCLDAGDPASVFANEPDPNGGRSNIGPYGNTVEASKTYIPTYPITTAAGENGTISPVNPSVIQGDDQTFTISANTGYHIESLTVDGSPVPVAANYTFNNVHSAHSIAATFAINRYTVTFNLGDGMRSGGGDLSQQVLHGDTVVAPIVTPPAGQRFKKWSSALGPIFLNRTIKAEYEKIGSQWHMVTFSPGAHGNRAGGGELSQQVLHAYAAVAPTIAADTGWSFAGWSAPFDAVLADLKVEAIYVRDPAYKQLTVESAYGTPSVNDTSMILNDEVVMVSMDSMEISDASAIHTCTGWSASDGSSGSGSTASLTMDQDVTLTWNWDSQYYLSVSSSGPGSVDMASGYFPAQSTVVLTAISDLGSEFQGWNGAASGMNPEASIPMDGAKNVTASFGAHLVIATIKDLSPDRTVQDKYITFSGSAETSGGATISQVRWRMVELVDGIETDGFIDLSDQMEFSRSDLPVGHWRIVFDAQDSTGAWSDPSTRELRIENPAFLTDLKVTRTDMRLVAADGSVLDPMMANQVRLGDEVAVEITVHNLGGVAVTNPVLVSLYDGDGPSDLKMYSNVPGLLGVNSVSSIPAGGTTTTTFDWHVGYDFEGKEIQSSDDSTRLLKAVAEHADNHTEATDGDAEELPVYEANLFNNIGRVSILIGEVHLEDYTMSAIVGNTTVNEDREVILSGSATYDWLDAPDNAVAGAFVQVSIDGKMLHATTDSIGQFSVNAGYLPVGSYPVSAVVNDSTMMASNTAIAKVNQLVVPPPPKADLRVTAVQVAGPGMYETESTMPHTLLGSDVTLLATIRNYGNLTAGQPFDVTFSVDGSGEVIGTVTVTNSLSPWASRTVTCPVIWSTNGVGTYSLRATVDSLDQVDERNEENNSRSLAVAVHEARPDLRPYYISGQVVHTLSVFPASPVQGEQLMLGVDVFNAGPVPMAENSFAVRFLINGTMVGETNVTAALDRGGSIRVEIPWDTATVQPGYQTLMAIVDFNDEVLEDFENNNVAETTFDLAPAVPSLVLVQTDYEKYLYSRKAAIQTGGSLTLSVHVKNIGGADYEGGSFLRLSEGTLGNIVQSVPVPGMVVERTRDMQIIWTAPSTPGEYLLLVYVDGSTVSREVVVYEPGSPPPPPPPCADPGIRSSDISILGDDWTRGDLVQAGAMVHNFGTLPATNVLAQFYYSVDSVGYTPLGTSLMIDRLPVGGATNLTSTASLEAVEPYYTIKVRLIPSGGNDRTYNDVATRSFAIEAPWADAGYDQVSVVGHSVVLDGRASRYYKTCEWRFSSMPAGSAAQLTGADTERPTFVPDMPGRYEIQLQVMDGELYSPYAWVSVLVSAPVITSLTVESLYGSPVPDIGTHAVMIGSTNAVSVAGVTENGTNWSCIGWTGNGILPESGTTNSADVVVVDELPSIKWLWSTNYLIDVSTTGAGTVSGEAGLLAAGSTTVLIANPATGYAFSEWTGELSDCVVSGSTVEVPVDQARALVAHFRPVAVSDCAAQVTSINSVELSWSYAGLPEAEFRVERMLGGETHWQELATVSSLSFVDKTVSAGQSMFYRVIAVVGGLGSASANTQAEVPPLPEIEVSNVIAAQRPGTKLVDIWYDVTCSQTGKVHVSVAIYDNDAFQKTAATLTGDAGADVPTGTSRHILWDAGADYSNQATDFLSIGVEASVAPKMHSGSVPGMVYVPAFPGRIHRDLHIDQFEVTKQLWDSVYNWALANGYEFDNPGTGKAASHPVHTVTWYDAVKWCNARSEMEGLEPCMWVAGNEPYRTGQTVPLVNWYANGYRLPDASEWRRAAEGNSGSLYYPWGETITHSIANYYSTTNYVYDVSPIRGYHPDYNDGTQPYTAPVGSFEPNSFGMFDVIGNVFEWCQDTWITPRGERYVPLKGGSWSTDARSSRVSSVRYISRDRQNNDYGFRTCRTAIVGDGAAVSGRASLVTQDCLLDVDISLGAPEPAPGTHAYAWGTTVTCSVDQVVSFNGTDYSCIGWIGTGSVPVSGTGNETVVTLTNVDSSVAWQWNPPLPVLVNKESANPVVPYITWETAATRIQDAVDIASAGMTVLITNGTYYPAAEITVNQNITIQSVNGPEVTVVDGGGTNRCFNLGGAACIISGLTIANGYAIGNGGGVYCSSRIPVLENCIISSNSADYGGGMMNGTANNCIIIANSADCGGGMIGGMANNCTISGNTANRGGGVFIGSVYNSIIWGNHVAIGSDLEITDAMNSCSPNLQHGVDGNITNAPLFVNPVAEDYRLQSNSPCINWGNNTYATGTVDLDGNPRMIETYADMGCYEYQGTVGLNGDLNGNGLLDEWERQHFGGQVDPGKNTDGDPQSDVKEYIAGTDPADSASCFMVSRFATPGAETGGFVVEWVSIPDRLYSVQWTTNLTAGFQTLETGIEYPQNSYTDTVHAVEERGYYKVNVQLK